MKIKPKIRGPKNYVAFEGLNLGDTFIYHGMLLMKMEDVGDYLQNGLNLATGIFETDLCDKMVLPVDAVLTWTKREE